MKRFLSVLLCVLMVALLTPAAFAADGFYNVLSGETWNFAESNNVEDYGFAINYSDNSPVSLSENAGPDGSKAMVLTRGSDAKNVGIAFYMPTGDSAEAVETKFNFKVTSKNVITKFAFREGSSDFNVLSCSSGNVNFLNNKVETYDANQWYDVEILVDVKQGYGRLKFRKCGDEAWKVHHVLAGNEMLKGKTKTERLTIGLQTLSSDYSSEQAVLSIDNYYQNRVSGVNPMILDAEDFSNVALSADSKTIGTWSTGNVAGKTGVTVGTEQLNGNPALMISAENISNNAYVTKSIESTTFAKAPADTNYVFKFKFGWSASTSNAIGATLKLGSTEIWLIRANQNGFSMFGAYPNNAGATSASFGAIEPGVLYDVEAVYNPTAGKLRVVAENASGTQVSGVKDISGTPASFAFRNSSQNTATSVGYFDDFETKIITPGGPVFDTATVASGDEDAALLGETVEFTYDRTIDQSALSDAVVTLKVGENEEETLTADKYAITSIGNKVKVTLLTAVEKGTEYKVTITGVKDLAGGQTTAAGECTYTTSATDIMATKPEINDTTLSTTVKSWYAQGKKVKLIAALYNAEGTKLVDVSVKEFTVSNKDGENLSHDFSDVFNTDGKKMGFVWSDFNTMIPYAEASSN